MKFKKGDVVKLNSGSPKMTVREIEDDMVYTIWFDEKNVVKYGEFNQELLIDAATGIGVKSER